MPRRGGGAAGCNNKKIVIRQYAKPPQLPPHYYETTSRAILDDSLSLLSSSSVTGGGTTVGAGKVSSTSSSNVSYSLQAAYTAATQLVRHGMGPRLYGDLVKTLDLAAQRILHSEHGLDLGHNSSSSSRHDDHRSERLARMASQYQAYTDYLLLMKHICLQLDSQLLWDPVSQTAWCHGGSGSSGNNTSSLMMLGGGSSKNGYTLWRVGLLVFAKRLEPLQPDIYQHWLAEFLADWNVHHHHHHDDDPHSQNDDAGMTKQQQQHQATTTDRSILQAVWYMWHDLPDVLDETQLQNDLEAYWTEQQQQQLQRHPSTASPGDNIGTAAATTANNNDNTNNRNNGGGRPNATLTGARMGYVYEIFQRCHRYDPWLPVAWLQHIIDTQLYQPQATVLSDDICAALLSEGIESFVSSSSSTDNHANNMIYQWWTLHTRYNAADAPARLQGFAKQAAAHRSIADLLQFQHHFSIVLQMLPGAVAAVPTKAIYEAVVTEEVAETLAKYLDGILKSTKKLDLQPKDWLHKVIVGVFVPLSSKDVFEAFYKKDLAKRLLWNRVVSMDVEKQVCSMLKAECGSGYTSKIEGMFQDIENSRETMLVYQQQQQQPATATTDATTFEVQVLTTGYWPLYPEYPNLILPQFLQDHQDHFVEFYKSKYQGRRVAWKYALGHCVIKTRGFGKPYELVLSLTQAIVLIQFGGGGSSNNNDGGGAATTTTTRTLPELIKLTGLEDRDEMERILQSLSLGKDGTRILRKIDHPAVAPATSSGSAAASAPPAAASKPKRIVSDSDTFCINESFSNKALRIRITNIMTKETKQERDTTVAAVCRDRLYLIDAAIVRILKSRKSLLHQALVPQVLEHLKFPAKIPDIKLRIESLIEREYVERDAQDRNRYNYLA
jgi:hypothetical protein